MVGGCERYRRFSGSKRGEACEKKGAEKMTSSAFFEEASKAESAKAENEDTEANEEDVERAAAFAEPATFVEGHGKVADIFRKLVPHTVESADDAGDRSEDEGGW
jgi:hypothetical protein